MTKKHMKSEGNEMDQDNLLQEEDEKLFDFDKANPDSGEEEDLRESSDDAEDKQQGVIAELKDKQLRLLAEFENYKKRSMRERLDLLSTASKEVIMSLLPVLDDFDRAKKSADDPSTGEQFSEGVTMVYNRLYQILQAAGLKAMDSTGQPFDAEYHDAITEIPAPTEDLKGKVIDTIEKGYMLNDKIIRHAKVVVGN